MGHPHESAVPLPPEEWVFMAQVPAVVSQEQLDLAKEKLSKNKSFARRNIKANEHLLRALVSCGECMQASTACARSGSNNHDRKQRYYVCSGKFSKAQSTPKEKCPSSLRPGRAARRDRLEGSLGGPDPLREHHGRAAAGGMTASGCRRSCRLARRTSAGPPSDASWSG
jgi:hypothetical protein